MEKTETKAAAVGPRVQKIVVFQQNRCGETKLKGIRKYGEGLFDLEVISVDGPLPPVIDDTEAHIPATIDADLVLDFLKHPDLSHDLAEICRIRNIPVVASGKKLKVQGTLTPPV